jgi:hypothetical protein
MSLSEEEQVSAGKLSGIYVKQGTPGCGLSEPARFCLISCSVIMQMYCKHMHPSQYGRVLVIYSMQI